MPADKPVRKCCSKCKQSFELSHFYSDKRTPDGRKCWCKTCFGESRDQYKRDHAAELKVKNRAYRDRTRAHIYEWFKEYRNRNRAQIREWQRKYELQHPEMRKARLAILHGVQSGKIVKPKSCSRCRRIGPVEGHHEDYTKPLVVLWMCRVCHMAAHGKKPRMSAVLTIDPPRRKRAATK